MKFFFAISFMFLYSVLFSDTHNILLHGHAKHFKNKDKDGSKFNEENRGFGYLYKTNKGKNDFFSFGASLIVDSYQNSFSFVNAGYNYNLLKSKYGNVFLTGNIFIGYKKEIIHQETYGYYYSNNRYYYRLKDVKKIEGDYRVIPGILPGITYEYNDFFINYNISPTLNSTEYYAPGFHYFTLGIRI